MPRRRQKAENWAEQALQRSIQDKVKVHSESTVPVLTFDTPLRVVGSQQERVQCRFSPSGTFFASVSTDQTACIWDTETGTMIRSLYQGGAGRACCFSPDGKLMYSAAGSNVHVWDTNSWKSVIMLQEHMSFTTGIDAAPDGRTLVSCSGDGSVLIWSTSIWEVLGSGLGHEGPVQSVSHSQDGSKLCSSSMDASTRLWKTDCKPVMQLQMLRGHQAPLWNCQLSHNGKMIASASQDPRVGIWNFQRMMERLDLLPGHTEAVRDCRFSPCQTLMLSASHDRTMRLWSVERPCCVAVLTGHKGKLWGCDYHPQGKVVIGGCEDGTVSVWKVPDNPLAHVRAVEEEERRLEAEELQRKRDLEKQQEQELANES